LPGWGGLRYGGNGSGNEGDNYYLKNEFNVSHVL
jgi:hypothetical protein